MCLGAQRTFTIVFVVVHDDVARTTNNDVPTGGIDWLTIGNTAELSLKKDECNLTVDCFDGCDELPYCSPLTTFGNIRQVFGNIRQV